MKLTKAQEEVLNDAKQEIDEARKYNTFEEYFINEKLKCYYYKTIEEFKEKDSNRFNIQKEIWKENRNAIVSTKCNSKTLIKLQELGLIELIYDSNGDNRGRDEIKVLNY